MNLFQTEVTMKMHIPLLESFEKHRPQLYSWKEALFGAPQELLSPKAESEAPCSIEIPENCNQASNQNPDSLDLFKASVGREVNRFSNWYETLDVLENVNVTIINSNYQ